MGCLDPQCEGEWGHSKHFRTILVDLSHIYSMVDLLTDDHPNIVQWTQLLIILTYVGIIEHNS